MFKRSNNSIWPIVAQVLLCDQSCWLDRRYRACRARFTLSAACNCYTASTVPTGPILLNCYHLFCMQVLNVPVHLRKKWEYLFLVVLAPWKPTSSSAALRMLVDELLLLHRGVDFLRADGVGGSLRAMMLMTVSDYRAHSIPASCSQHPGMYGCSKCRHRGRRAHGTTVYADYHRCGIR